MSHTCNRCGGEELETGQLVGPVGFKPTDSKLLTLRYSQVPVLGVMCRTCGALEFTGNLEALEELKPAESS